MPSARSSPRRASSRSHPSSRRDGDFARLPVGAGELPDAQFISADGDLRTLPCHWSEQGGMDGFYAARLDAQGLIQPAQRIGDGEIDLAGVCAQQRRGQKSAAVAFARLGEQRFELLQIRLAASRKRGLSR